MNQHLYNTPLFNRTLWYDGESSYDPTNLISLISKGYRVDWVDHITPEIISYNDKFATISQGIGVKNTCKALNKQWNLPKQYLELDVLDYVINEHNQTTNCLDPIEIGKRDERLVDELIKYRDANLLDVLRTIIYVINTLTSRGVVWGVGRGSSVASYVLYVIWVHDVDSFKYDLDINDFLHE